MPMMSVIRGDFRSKQFKLTPDVKEAVSVIVNAVQVLAFDRPILIKALAHFLHPHAAVPAEPTPRAATLQRLIVPPTGSTPDQS